MHIIEIRDVVAVKNKEKEKMKKYYMTHDVLSNAGMKNLDEY